MVLRFLVLSGVLGILEATELEAKMEFDTSGLFNQWSGAEKDLFNKTSQRTRFRIDTAKIAWAQSKLGKNSKSRFVACCITRRSWRPWLMTCDSSIWHWQNLHRLQKNKIERKMVRIVTYFYDLTLREWGHVVHCCIRRFECGATDSARWVISRDKHDYTATCTLSATCTFS